MFALLEVAHIAFTGIIIAAQSAATIAKDVNFRLDGDGGSADALSRTLYDSKDDDDTGKVTLGLMLILASLLCMGTWSTLLRLCTVFTGIAPSSKMSRTSRQPGDKSDIELSANNAALEENASASDTTTVHKERFGQNRHPCHVYLDYAVSYVAIGSLVLPAVGAIIHFAEQFLSESEANTSAGSALKLSGSQWPNEDTITRSPSSWRLVMTALLGGSLLAVGNLTTQWATTAFGAPLTTVLALQASMCVSIGTYWNYKLQPELTSSPFLLMLGVGMFLVAIICSVYAQSGYQNERQFQIAPLNVFEDKTRTGEKQEKSMGMHGVGVYYGKGRESSPQQYSRTLSNSSANNAFFGRGDDSTTGFSLPPYCSKADNASPGSIGQAYQKRLPSSRSLSVVSDDASSVTDKGMLKQSESTSSIGSYGSLNATPAKISGTPDVVSSSSPFNLMTLSNFNGVPSSSPPQNIEGLCSSYHSRDLSQTSDPLLNGSDLIVLSDAAAVAASVAASSKGAGARGSRRSLSHVPSCVQLPVHREGEETDFQGPTQDLNESSRISTIRKQVSLLEDTNDDPCERAQFASENAYTADPNEETSIDEEMSLLNKKMSSADVNTDIVSHEKKKSATIGILVAVFGGLCFGFFSPLFNISVNDPFHWSNNNNGGLVVSSANSLFAASFTMSSIIWNVYLMTYPPKVGEVIVEASTISQYFSREPLGERLLAFSAGALCSIANALQFHGGELAGFAAADMVQAFPLVATVWDAIVFGEFRSASPRIICLLAAMYGAYIGGMVCLASSVNL